MNKVKVGGTAEEVRDFYDRYPYPRPVDSLDKYRQIWQDPARRRAEHCLRWPTDPYREDRSILVAGCGTSQAAKHALRWPAARVVGIDVSATSVECTAALKQKYGLDNLEVRQLPIERVAELGASFDHVVSTGVLHHLADPDAGLRALRGVLNADGAMDLMVYAPYGRTGVYMLQEFCRRLGIAATDEGIRDLISALEWLPPAHPLQALVRVAPDLKQEFALADALLHPQDRAYSVPQLFDFLERGGMAFGRWVRQAPYSPQCGFLAKLPQASRMAELPPVDRYAAAEVFRGTMVRHAVIAYRDDRPGGLATAGPAGERGLDDVPIRLPNTICLEERLPPGAAAVLINQSHTDTDLYLPIDGEEKRLFDAIDGSRTIAEIAQGAGSPDARARAFLERLWWWDQVVFDASVARPASTRPRAT